MFLWTPKYYMHQSTTFNSKQVIVATETAWSWAQSTSNTAFEEDSTLQWQNFKLLQTKQFLLNGFFWCSCWNQHNSRRLHLSYRPPISFLALKAGRDRHELKTITKTLPSNQVSLDTRIWPIMQMQRINLERSNHKATISTLDKGFQHQVHVSKER